jgi:predicted Zn-dependent peptidase
MHQQGYDLHTLSSGLRVLLIPMKSVKSATVLLYVNTGSRYEPAKWGGISHFLEHMVFKGTAKYPTPRELSAAVDAVGAEFNAFTSKEYTAYYVKSASKDIGLSLDVVSDMFLTPTLKDDDLQREKGVIIEELNMYQDTPIRHIGEVFEQLMFKGNPMGRDIIGTKKTINALQRDDFVQYLKQWYGLGNVVLTIAGDDIALKDPALLKTIERCFSKTSDTSDRSNGGERKLGNVLSKDGYMNVEYKKTEQAHFVMAVPGLKRGSEDKYANSALSVILGGNMSSRLFTEVREKRGLCYYVRADGDTYHDVGSFGASAGVDPKRVEEAVKVVKDELFGLADSTGSRAITESELKRAKDFLIGKTVLDFEDSETVANYFGSKYLLEGKVMTIDEAIEKIRAVTLDDVQTLAKRLLDPSQLYFAMLGPFKDSEKFEKILRG